MECLRRLACLVGLTGSITCLSGNVTADEASSTDSASRGEKIFHVCGACHTTSPDVHGIGPSLAGIVGAKPARIDGFPYSKGMIAFSNSVDAWDEKNLDAFIRRPRKVVKGTTMPYRSLRDPKDRKDLIAYLKRL